MGSPRPLDERIDTCDVLVVGAGPTGLALAAELTAFGVSLRVVDAAADRVHESRALAVQPRTLEVLRPLGVHRELIERGNPAARLRITAGGRVACTPLFDIGAEDTAFPFLRFVSQAETEAVLGEHLTGHGVAVERGVTLESFRPGADGTPVCSLRHADGTREVVRARYLVGCDGARSTVREQAGIPFVGGRYPQAFLLADLAADGLDDGTVHAYLGPEGPLFFFPLGRPAPWRLITMRPRTGAGTGPERVPLAELQQASDRATGGAVRVRDPVWTSVFHVHHRAASRYRAGRAFVAGDAAHVHSPAGAQGMNTGIQDAVNLGRKLGLVCRHGSPEALLDSYDAERRPVGEFVLRFTDRAFTAATSANPLIRAVRSHVVPRVLPLVLRFRAGRRLAFRTVSQLGIHYRHSPAVESSRSVGRGPRPGDRLPDARVRGGGTATWLQEALSAPTFHLVLCGPVEGWDDAAVDGLRRRYEPLLTVHRLTAEGDPTRAGDAVLSDSSGTALARLGVRGRRAWWSGRTGTSGTAATTCTSAAPAATYVAGCQRTAVAAPDRPRRSAPRPRAQQRLDLRRVAVALLPGQPSGRVGPHQLDRRDLAVELHRSGEQPGVVDGEERHRRRLVGERGRRPAVLEAGTRPHPFAELVQVLHRSLERQAQHHHLGMAVRGQAHRVGAAHLRRAARRPDVLHRPPEPLDAQQPVGPLPLLAGAPPQEGHR